MCPDGLGHIVFSFQLLAYSQVRATGCVATVRKWRCYGPKVPLLRAESAVGTG